ncbi:ANTAR domain-containing response regulator [Haloechinothrix halophila]|uniref:ANTAR domain-containing response regulator n=1 Tax=Haloechinothrix halophila TaxID=1069073 RepID=UPI00054D37E0|nr:GAF and ANTAR domain-containing protein [Haloechinothrix halophila]
MSSENVGHTESDRFDAVAGALERLRGIHDVRESLDAVLQQFAESARDTIDGADAVSVTTLDGDEPRTAAATDLRVVQIDEAQYAAGDGPCLEAARTKQPVRALVREARERWPEFVGAAERLGVRSYLSAPLLIDAEGDSELVGALDVYGWTDGAFDPLDTALLRILTLAASATISTWHRLRRAREVIDQLDEALTSRAEIEQAKGVLMALNKISADEAFARLVKLSQDSNVKLRDLSRQLLVSLRES